MNIKNTNMKNKVIISIFIFAIINFGIYLYLAINKDFFIHINDLIRTAFLLLGMISFLFSILLYSDKIEMKDKIEKTMKLRKNRNKIRKKFKDNKEIFINVKRGYLLVPFVIKKDLGWVYKDGRIFLKNDHFSIDEILEYSTL